MQFTTTKYLNYFRKQFFALAVFAPLYFYLYLFLYSLLNVIFKCYAASLATIGVDIANAQPLTRFQSTQNTKETEEKNEMKNGIKNLNILLRLGRKIGSGSFGDIYLGTNISTGEEGGEIILITAVYCAEITITNLLQ